MGRRNATENWIEATKFQLSPAPAPPPWDSHKQDDELQFLRDRHYFMHGEIIAVTVITAFVIFLLFLVVPCVRRTITIPSSAASESSDSAKTKKRNCLHRLLMLRRKGKADDQEQFDGKTSEIQQPAGDSSSC